MAIIPIRAAVPSDLKAVQEFGERVVVPYYEALNLAAYARALIVDYWDDESILASMAQEQTLVAERDGALVGLAVFSRFEGEPVIWKLYVQDGLRGQGLGRRLIEAVEARLPEEDQTILIEHASENERAAKAYDGLEFEIAWIDHGDDPGGTTVWRRRRKGGTP